MVIAMMVKSGFQQLKGIIRGLQSFPRGHLMVIAGFFVLGGAFWDKIRVQFFRDSLVVPSSAE